MQYPELRPAFAEMWAQIAYSRNTGPESVFVHEVKETHSGILKERDIESVLNSEYIMDSLLNEVKRTCEIKYASDGAVVVTPSRKGKWCLRLEQKGADVHATFVLRVV